jgi:hypothetical protein
MQATTFSFPASAVPPSSKNEPEEDLGVSTMEGLMVLSDEICLGHGAANALRVLRLNQLIVGRNLK